MGIRRTQTNPSGLPMQKHQILLPVDTTYKLSEVSRDTHKNKSVLIREYIEKGVREHIMKGNK